MTVTVAGVRPYIVRQGDYVAKIAVQVGCGEDEIWEHPKNQPLKDSGRTRTVLAPGDVLCVPDDDALRRDVRLQSNNEYRCTIPRVKVRVVFKQDGQACGGRDYRVLDLGDAIEGRTDAQGALTCEVPVDTRSIRVVLLRPFVQFRVDVGHVDPVTASSGVRGRLRQLGYLSPEPDDVELSEQAEQEALRAFQSARALEPTGEADETTQARLVREFRGT